MNLIFYYSQINISNLLLLGDIIGPILSRLLNDIDWNTAYKDLLTEQFPKILEVSVLGYRDKSSKRKHLNNLQHRMNHSK